MIIYKNIYKTKEGIYYMPLNVYESKEEAIKLVKKHAQKHEDEYKYTIAIKCEMV